MASLRQAPLTQEAATTRLNHFAADHKLAYHLFLKFDRADTYQGRVTATFTLQQVSKDFFIDWSGSDITSLSVNGVEIKQAEDLRKDRFLYFPQENLKIGENTITIGFKNKFARNGQGLHGFIDTDGKQYFYSELEPYYCNLFFPTFDQPELKAPLYLTTAAPKEWVVVANNPVNEKASVKVEDYISSEEVATHKIQVYTPTPKISSYLYCCCGGDYKVIKNDDPDCKISQTIFCRESLLTLCQAQAKEIFLIHKESIRFYENYFGVPYPFEKCDSLFAVEYNMGAMENPGLILYNDRYIWKDAVTKDQNTMRANVICHEVSHQWFGNLVTMKWWNDLWLNESFAEYISHYCQSKIQQKLRDQGVAHIDPWALIHLRKENGYIEDQQCTTHPIAGCVHDTDQAKSIFDGITYSKGAATIRQLMAFVGEENFGKALGEYFKKYSWSNTTLADFIGALQNYYKPALENAPKDLNTWSKEWLETAGLNTADPVWDPKDTSSKAKLTVTQGVALSDYPTLRHHKIKIAFFNDEAKIYDVKEVILSNKEQTIIEYDGSKQPRAILLNYADEAFIKVSVDLESLNFFKLNLQKIDEDLTRILIWRAFYDQARDGHWSIYQFTHFAGHSLHHEQSNVVARFILQFSNVLVTLIPKVLKENFVLPELFHGVLKALEKTDKADSARLVLLRDHLVLYASYGELKKVDNVARLMDWFTGVDAELSSQPLSLKNQWAIVEHVHCYPKASELTMKAFFDKVAEKDKSDEMTRNQKRCEAIKANKKQRAEIWNQFLNSEDSTSLHTLAEMMRGYRLNPRWNHDDEKAFFNNMVTVYEKRDFFIGRSFVTEMFPRGDNLEFYIASLEEVAKKAQHAMLKKQIGQHQDNLKRKQKCYLAAAPDLLKLTFNINI